VGEILGTARMVDRFDTLSGEITRVQDDPSSDRTDSS
jgi:hypothetical protein